MSRECIIFTNKNIPPSCHFNFLINIIKTIYSVYYNISLIVFEGFYRVSLIAAKRYLTFQLFNKTKTNVWKWEGSANWMWIFPGMDQILATSPARALRYCLMLSSFSSSMSFREAFTLFDTSFPWEKSLCRSLKVRLSGAPPIVFSWSGLPFVHFSRGSL